MYKEEHDMSDNISFFIHHKACLTRYDNKSTFVTTCFTCILPLLNSVTRAEECVSKNFDKDSKGVSTVISVKGLLGLNVNIIFLTASEKEAR